MHLPEGYRRSSLRQAVEYDHLGAHRMAREERLNSKIISAKGIKSRCPRSSKVLHSLSAAIARIRDVTLISVNHWRRRASLQIQGEPPHLWSPSVAQIRHTTGVRRRSRIRRRLLRWPKLGGAACIILRVESWFDLAKPRVRRSLWASPVSPVPHRRWAPAPSQHFDLVLASVVFDRIHGPPVSVFDIVFCLSGIWLGRAPPVSSSS
jgi:hypothetical protein